MQNVSAQIIKMCLPPYELQTWKQSVIPSQNVIQEYRFNTKAEFEYINLKGSARSLKTQSSSNSSLQITQNDRLQNSEVLNWRVGEGEVEVL